MTQYDDIVVTPVYGPLSTNQYPCAMPPHNSGALPGRHPNPPQFYPADGSSNFSIARREYARVSTREPASNTKYIAPVQSSMYVCARKREAVGKASYKQGLSDSALLSYKGYNVNDANHARRVARSHGCVAPKKKGATQNTYSNVGGWGSIVRNTY
jgi:hypothetical protein